MTWALNCPAVSLSDPEVTVLEERSQAIVGVVALIAVAHGELHLGPPLFSIQDAMIPHCWAGLSRTRLRGLML
jgi:hypothetical protein